MIPPSDLLKALAGDDPPGPPLSLSQLGRRLGDHRRNGHAGEPYRKQTVALYLAHPDRQGPDFEEAFLSWRTAARLQRADLRTRYQHLEEMLSEAPFVAQIGANPVRSLLLVGDLPADILIEPNAAVPTSIICRAEIAACPCGQRFVKRTPRPRFCSPTCPARS